MKLPRDVSGFDLVKVLKPLGYQVTRQAGSHMRLSTEQNGVHHITIPNHNPIKIGTLTAILNDEAAHHLKSKEELIMILWG